jgi:hypothetical protein
MHIKLVSKVGHLEHYSEDIRILPPFFRRCQQMLESCRCSCHYLTCPATVKDIEIQDRVICVQNMWKVFPLPELLLCCSGFPPGYIQGHHLQLCTEPDG